MKVLALDPGLTRLGYASCQLLDNGDYELGLSGIITHSRGTEKFNEYLNSGIHNICEKFPYLITLTSPDIIVAELVPVGRLGSRSELVVAAITACKVIAYQAGLPWKDVAANSYKKALTGNGAATKGDIKKKVYELYPHLKQKDKDERKRQRELGEKVTGFPADLYDAIAIAHYGVIRFGD